MSRTINTGRGFREKLSVLAGNKCALARKAGLSQSSIHDMIRGHRRPYLDQGLAIARALNVPLDYLADDSMTEPPPAPGPQIEPADMDIVRLSKILGHDEAVRRLLRIDQ